MFRSKGNGEMRARERNGIQEAIVLVRGGYRPDTILAEQGKPVRLVFRRDESSPCSEEVVFEQFGVRTPLPQGEEVALELPPSAPGEYAFACGHGMLHGRLIIQ